MPRDRDVRHFRSRFSLSLHIPASNEHVRLTRLIWIKSTSFWNTDPITAQRLQTLHQTFEIFEHMRLLEYRRILPSCSSSSNRLTWLPIAWIRFSSTRTLFNIFSCGDCLEEEQKKSSWFVSRGFFRRTLVLRPYRFRPLVFDLSSSNCSRLLHRARLRLLQYSLSLSRRERSLQQEKHSSVPLDEQRRYHVSGRCVTVFRSITMLKIFVLKPFCFTTTR